MLYLNDEYIITARLPSVSKNTNHIQHQLTIAKALKNFTVNLFRSSKNKLESDISYYLEVLRSLPLLKSKHCSRHRNDTAIRFCYFKSFLIINNNLKPKRFKKLYKLTHFKNLKNSVECNMTILLRFL